MKQVVISIGIFLGTTIGAGIFALPFVFYSSSWTSSLIYLVLLAFVVSLSHFWYLKALEKDPGREGLLGMVKKYFGKAGLLVGLISISLGLLLTLLIYLILGREFLMLLYPNLPGGAALIIFWLIASAPIIFRKPRLLSFEFGGAVVIAAIILFVLLKGGGTGFNAELFSTQNIFLPFGPILFSLAAWTAVEPASKILWNVGEKKRFWAISGGTFLSALLYIFFVLGIFNSTTLITADTISGLLNWNYLELALLAVLGLFAIWTSYIPAALEIRNGLKEDAKWNGSLVLFISVLLPLIIVGLGFDDFIKIISLAGGLFLSLEYILILLLSQKILKLRGALQMLLYLFIVVFVAGGVYELLVFLK